MLTALQFPPSADRVTTYSQLIATPQRPITWHWHQLVPAGAVAIVTGPGGCGKSWLMLQLALCTAAGRPMLGEPVQQGPAVYISGENSPEEDHRRVHMLRAGLDLPAEGLPFYLLRADDLSLAEDYDEVVRLLQPLRPTMVVIDSVVALAGIKDENDNVQAREFVKRKVVPLARQLGTTPYLIHHPPKPPRSARGGLTAESAARGASDWRNGVEAQLWIGPHQRGWALHHGKARIGREHGDLWYELEEDGLGLRVVGGPIGPQEAGSPLAGAVAEATALLRVSPGGARLADLHQAMVAKGFTQKTARNATDVLRGKRQYEGKVEGTVLEHPSGRDIRLSLAA